jgi:alpha-N-arabinofuranosidase
MPTFAAWEATVLDHTLDVVDFISAHAYYQVKDGDVDSFLASSLNMEAFIAEVVATIDHVAARKRSRKRVDISFDEWNVWYNEELHDEWLPTEWVEAPPLSEDAYTVTDAVVVGSLLITLLRNCDRVTSACLAQLVNTIATIRTSTTPGGPAWRQTTFYPFSQAAQNARGQVLRVEPVGDVIETKLHGEAPCVDAVATYDEETLTLFAVNRHRSENAQLSVDLRGVTGLGVVEHLVLADDDPNAANTESQPDRVTPRTADTPSLDDGQLEVTLSPVSWNVIRLARR